MIGLSEFFLKVQGLYLAPTSIEKCLENADSNVKFAVPKKPQSTKLVAKERFWALDATDAENKNIAVRKIALFNRLITQ